MIQYNADIGFKSQTWTDQELIDIEQYFWNEHLPRKVKQDYLDANLGNEKDVGLYPVVLKFDKVVACLGHDLDILLIGDTIEEINNQYDRLFDQLNTNFPKKTLRKGLLYKVSEFVRINRDPSPTDKPWYKKDAIIISIISASAIVLAAIISIL